MVRRRKEKNESVKTFSNDLLNFSLLEVLMRQGEDGEITPGEGRDGAR
jgi:hypothetical protein